MRVPPVYASASDVYTGQNNYLNKSQTQVGTGCELIAYTGIRQTRMYMAKNYLNIS